MTRDATESDQPMFGWMTVRRIKPGMMEAFRERWYIGPEAATTDPYSGIPRVYFMQDTADPNRMIGLGIFTGREAFDHWISSEVEADRRFEMDQFVETVEEESTFWVSEY